MLEERRGEYDLAPSSERFITLGLLSSSICSDTVQMFPTLLLLVSFLVIEDAIVGPNSRDLIGFPCYGNPH